MPTKVLNREYTNMYRPETTDWLLGNVGEWQNVKIKTETGVYYEATKYQTLGVEAPSTLQAGNGIKWNDQGFEVGDSINIEYVVTIDVQGATPIDLPFSTSTTITSIQGTTMVIAYALALNFPPVLPYQTAGVTSSGNSFQIYYTQIVLWADKKPDAVELFYMQNDNNSPDPSALQSLWDGTKTRLLANGLAVLIPSQFEQFDQIGNQSGHGIRLASIEFIQKNGDYKYEFDIFIFYLLGFVYSEKQNIINNFPPDPLRDDNSLMDNFQIKYFPEFNNPNLGIPTEMNDSEYFGNTGWFNENFNGLETSMQLNTVLYYDVATGDNKSALDYARPTRIEFPIEGIANLSATTRVGIYLQWVTDTDDFTKENEFPYHENHFVNSGGIFVYFVCDGVNNGIQINGLTRLGNARLDINNRKADITGTDSVLVQFEVLPTAEFTQFMDGREDDDRTYVIGCNIGDQTLVTNYSDRVMFYDSQDFIKTLSPSGPHSPLTIEWANHPNQDEEFDLDNTYFVEDESLMTSKFSINPLVDGKLLQVETNFEAYNVNTDESFSLDQSLFTTQNAVQQAGVQQINQFGTRNYIMNSGNNKNYLNVFRNSANDGGGLYAYILQVAFQTRWEYWIGRANVNSDFYDINEPQDGLNNNWRPYDDGGDWVLRVNIQMLWERPDGSTELTENTDQFNALFYDESTEIQGEMKLWTDETLSTPLTISIDPNTGEEITAIPDSGEVVVAFDFTRIDNGDLDGSDHYGVLRFQQFNGGGQPDIRRLSSVWDSEPNNPLIPLSTETHAKVEQIDPKTVRVIGKLTTTNFDTSQALWWLSGRLGFYCIITEEVLAWINNQWNLFVSNNPHLDLEGSTDTLFTIDKGEGNIFEITNADVVAWWFEQFQPCGYYVNKYGPNGLNYTKGDWYSMIFFYDDFTNSTWNSSANDLTYNLEGTFYFQNSITPPTIHNWSGVGMGIIDSVSSFLDVTSIGMTQTSLFGEPSTWWIDNCNSINLYSSTSFKNKLDYLWLRPSNHQINLINFRGNLFANRIIDIQSVRPNAHGVFEFSSMQWNKVLFPTNLISNDTTSISLASNNTNEDQSYVYDFTGLTLNQCAINASYCKVNTFLFASNTKLRSIYMFQHTNVNPFIINLTNVEMDGSLSQSWLYIRSNAVSGITLNPLKSYNLDLAIFFNTLMDRFNSASIGVWDLDSSPVNMKNGAIIDVQEVAGCTDVIPPSTTDNIARITLFGSINITVCDLSGMTVNQNGILLNWRQSGIALDNSANGGQETVVDQIIAQGWLNGTLNISTFAGTTPPNANTLLKIGTLIGNGWTVTHD
jgi:hypothetical protein